MNKTSVYDSENFFDLYLKLRQNPESLNDLVEKPTMLSLLPDLTGKTLLDLGCGMGEHLDLYLEGGAKKVTGVDLSLAMLKEAEKNLKTKYSTEKFSLYQGAMEEIEHLPLSPVDFVVSSFALHYVEDFPALLEKVRPLLKPKGYFIFSQEHPIVTCHKGGDRWRKDENKRHVAYQLSHYRNEGKRERNWFKQPFTTYHRAFSTIINDLIHAGFEIEAVKEPMHPLDETVNFPDLQHRPVLLFVKARKK